MNPSLKREIYRASLPCTLSGVVIEIYRANLPCTLSGVVIEIYRADLPCTLSGVVSEIYRADMEAGSRGDAGAPSLHELGVPRRTEYRQ